MPDVPTAATVARALRLLATQQKASRNYYERHRERIRQRSAAYWEQHKDALNAVRFRAFSDSRRAALTLGLGTVAATHAEWDEDMMRKHAIVNLAAAAAVAYGSRIV